MTDKTNECCDICKDTPHKNGCDNCNCSPKSQEERTPQYLTGNEFIAEGNKTAQRNFLKTEEERECMHHKQTAKWVCDKCEQVFDDMQELANEALSHSSKSEAQGASWEEKFAEQFICEPINSVWTVQERIGKDGNIMVALKNFITKRINEERKTAVNEWIKTNRPIIDFKCSEHKDAIPTCLACSQKESSQKEIEEKRDEGGSWAKDFLFEFWRDYERETGGDERDTVIETYSVALAKKLEEARLTAYNLSKESAEFGFKQGRQAAYQEVREVINQERIKRPVFNAALAHVAAAVERLAANDKTV